MKKSLMVLCGAALALASFAEPADAPQRPKGDRPMPTMLVVDGKTTIEQVEAFKKQICEKVDAAVAAQAAKTGDNKQPTRIVLFVNDRGFGPGMGPQGRGGRRGPDGKGQDGKGPRRRRGAEGAPNPPPAE